MTSDSSDEDNSELLREAVDTQFINDGMFNRKSKTTNGTPAGENINNLPSLRPNINKDDQFNMLGVTPQFQEYVAKQLASMLDKKLEKSLRDGISDIKSRKRKKSGIKLFSDSTKYVKLKDKVLNVVKKPTSSKSDSEGDTEHKFSEIAVSADDILSKKDTIHWAPSHKSKIFKYKKSKTGTLTSTE